MRQFFGFFAATASFVFPNACICCGEVGRALCFECQQSFSPAQLRCLACGRYNPFGLYCASCKRKHWPDRVVACFAYNSPVKELLHQFKYEDVFLLYKPLAKQLASRIFQIRNYQQFAVTFIPLSSNRYRWRGYNQAELLAREAAATCRLPVVDTLRRSRFYESQVKSQTKRSRKQNVKGAFEIKEKASVPKKVILIDDIVTTGATVEEATRVLKRAGVKEVIVIAVAMS